MKFSSEIAGHVRFVNEIEWPLTSDRERPSSACEAESAGMVPSCASVVKGRVGASSLTPSLGPGADGLAAPYS